MFLCVRLSQREREMKRLLFESITFEWFLDALMLRIQHGNQEFSELLPLNKHFKKHVWKGIVVIFLVIKRAIFQIPIRVDRVRLSTRLTYHMNKDHSRSVPFMNAICKMHFKSGQSCPPLLLLFYDVVSHNIDNVALHNRDNIASHNSNN